MTTLARRADREAVRPGVASTCAGLRVLARVRNAGTAAGPMVARTVSGAA